MAAADSIEFIDLTLGRVATIPIETFVKFSAPQAAAQLEKAAAMTDEIETSRSFVLAELHRRVGGAKDKKQRQALLNLKRQFQGAEGPLEIDEVLGDIEEVRRFLKLLRERNQALETSHKLFEEDERTWRVKFLELIRDPFFLETVQLSSRSLLEGIWRYRESPPGKEPSKHHRQLERAVMEHLARCCTKTTPRGTLTSVHPGQWDRSESRPFVIAPSPTGERIGHRRTSVATPVIRKIAASLSNTPGAWEFVQPRINPTLRLQDEKFQFWAMRMGIETLCSLPKSDLLHAIVELIKPRSLTAAQVVESLERRFEDYEKDDLRDYYRKLSDLNFIYGELEVPFPEVDKLAYLIAWCEGLPASVRPEALLGKLIQLHGLLKTLDTQGDPSTQYAAVEQILEDLGIEDPSVDQVLVVDSAASWQYFKLGPAVQYELELLIALLRRFSAGMGSRAREAERAIESFSVRFSGRTVVPAVELFLPENSPPRMQVKGETPTVLLERLRRLAGRVRSHFESSPSNSMELTLTEGEFVDICGSFEPSERPVEGLIAAHLCEGSGSGPLIVLDSIATSPGQGFSRWSHLFDSSVIEQAVSKYYRLLHNFIKPADWATILFSKDSRVDSANWHPSYHPFEIEAGMARSGFPGSRVLQLGDIQFRVQEGAQGKREMVVEWTAGEEVRRLHPVYEGILVAEHPILAQLDSLDSETTGMYFRPLRCLSDEVDADLKRFPRLKVGNIVLSRASWKFFVADLLEVVSGDSFEAFRKFNLWRAVHGIPRFFFVCKNENFMMRKPKPIDAWNPRMVETLGTELRNWNGGAQVWFQEMLPAPNELVARDGQGSYVHQMSIGFVCRK